MEEQTEQIQQAESKNWHDKYYKILLLIPIIILIASLVYLFYFYQKTGDIINRDISLKGGTSITVNSEADINELKNFLSGKLEDYDIRKISDLRTGKQTAFILETTSTPEPAKQALEEYLGYKLNEENSSTEFTGSTLSEGFYRQLLTALVIAFILMSIVIFILFRTFVPSIAVIFAAFADIVMPLALINYLGIKISAAGIAAFLMLIGYSVDTDILLTTRALKKREGSLNQRIYGAFKTGSLMTLTSLAAVLPAFFIVSGLPNSFRQIFLILSFGLFADLLNTWLTNIGIIKSYCQAKNIK